MAFTGLQYNPTSSYDASTNTYTAGTKIASVDAAAGKTQLQAFYWLRKSIITARKDQYFSPLASTVGMPKHFGKTIKCFEYVPLLDERNVNDQGLDAAGVTIDNDKWLVTFPAALLQVTGTSSVEGAAAKTAIEAGGGLADIAVTKGADDSGHSAGHVKLTLANRNAATGLIQDLFTTAQKNTLLALSLGLFVDGTAAVISAVQQGGNMYGSSKDIGTITGKIPVLGENGGRVNRVGFTRLQREGSISKFGFFYELNKESLDFDSDDELNEHLSRELMNGAVQLTEAVLQKDLLLAVGTIVYAGSATSRSTITGEGGAAASVVVYEDLMRLSQTLTDNRTPKQTKIITGSRLVDTKTIPAGRVMFIGSELVPVVRAMKDLFDNQAFIPVHMYADAGVVLTGEIGMVDEFRICVVPEMLHWSDGAIHTDGGEGYRVTGDKYNVYPMLVVGDDSFTTIGFQTDGKSAKFQVITKMPGVETADRNDPFGESGFSSLKWFYGTLIKRSERLGMILTVAPV